MWRENFATARMSPLVRSSAVVIARWRSPCGRTVRPAFAEPADDVVDRGAGQTLPFAGPVEIDEQRTGIARAKAEGKYKGQPPHARAKAPQVIELAASGRTRTEIAAALEISERSVYRILAESRPKTT